MLKIKEVLLPSPVKSYVQGTVTRVAGNGLQLHHSPGHWFNVSKFTASELQPLMPTVGEVISLGLDKDGYIREFAQPIEEEEPWQPAPSIPERAAATTPPPFSSTGPSRAGATGNVRSVPSTPPASSPDRPSAAMNPTPARSASATSSTSRPSDEERIARTSACKLAVTLITEVYEDLNPEIAAPRAVQIADEFFLPYIQEGRVPA